MSTVSQTELKELARKAKDLGILNIRPTVETYDVCKIIINDIEKRRNNPKPIPNGFEVFIEERV